MKKRNLYIIAFVLMFSLLTAFSAYAADTALDVVVSLQIDNPIMEINGTETEIDKGRGTTPLVVDNRTIVPIRAIIEAFGGTVSWNQKEQAVLLSMKDDSIKLVIGSNTAYLNGKMHTLDVAPAVINGRTMLPIRFIAEGFNLGVAWESDTRTVSVIRNVFEQHEYDYLMSVIADYSGNPYITINNNIPLFKEYEIIGGSFEYYSDLDSLDRCDVTMASVSEDIMPTEDRESIANITPTGWKNKSYDSVPGGYVYNRCHLIGYQLTGENDNERNLITGTRYLNIDGMLPFENMVDSYIEKSGNHVMYRVTPVFKGNNLVADGVLMEAYSVEDSGSGVSFCVYCYNTQPNITIDYSTGDNSLANSIPPAADNVPLQETKIYRTPSGKKYHFDIDCGGENSYEVTLNEALSAGLAPCKKCAQ